MKLLSGIFFIFLLTGAIAQPQMNFKFKSEVSLKKTSFTTENAPLGNSVSDLIFKDQLFIATSRGLSITDSMLTKWTEYGEDVFNGHPAITTIEIDDDGTIWLATAFDSVISGDELTAGGGLYYLRPGTSQWEHIPQPVDDRVDFDSTQIELPTTTNVQNVSYDLALHGSEIWIASWGGSIRKSTDNGQTWQVVSTNGRKINVLNFLEHRGFSLLSQADTMWVGTAGGIAKITPDDTTLFVHSDNSNSISGNWVIGLYEQEKTGWVWAITVKALGENERTSISATPDGGKTWLNFLGDEFINGNFPRDIDFLGDTILVAAEGGVYYSMNQGEKWQKMGLVVDEITGDPLFKNIFYSIAHLESTKQRKIWFGTSEGLVQTEDLQTFRHFRRFVTSAQNPGNPVFAYPNPFSPDHGDYLRIQFPIKQTAKVKVQIFNAAMEKIFETTENKSPVSGQTDQFVIWDGRSFARRMVANGLYFYKCNINGKTYWGKIVVIN